MLASTLVGYYTAPMIKAADHSPWGQDDFDYDLDWESLLSDGLGRYGLTLGEARDRASEDASFDVFSMVMPTDRAKHDIGRYVLGHGIDVPLINSMAEWQNALREGRAMLRSDSTRDYSGVCGLLTSKVIRLQADVGIPEAEPGRPTLDPVHNIYPPLRDVPLQVKQNKADIEALLQGTQDPSLIMRKRWWRKEQRYIEEIALERGMAAPRINLNRTYASRWRYVPGINVRVFRDPIVEGKYYLGGRDAHHEWAVTDGRDSPDVEAHTKSGYRRGETPETFEYSLPTGRIIDLYETVRELPFFDQTQAPVMELQLGTNGVIHFLQYLKAGQEIQDVPEFSLPQNNNAITCGQVRGVTKPEGEKMRMYLDPRTFTNSMRGAGVQVAFNMTMDPGGVLLQTAAMNSKVVVTDYNLNFKDNHSNSAPLFRPPVAIGMWDGLGGIGPKLQELNEAQPFYLAWDPIDTVEYIDTIVTSNGRQATIESDWQIKSQRL